MKYKYFFIVIMLVLFIQEMSFASGSKDKVKKVEKTDLWILGIGIDTCKIFPIEVINKGEAGLFEKLDNPVKDTKRIIECLSKQKGISFKNVHSSVLFDDFATKQNILKSFNFISQAKPDDIVFLYINAHGITTEDGIYCFLPYDIEVISYENNRNIFDFSSVVNIQDIMQGMAFPAQKILFLETCGSGGAFNADNIYGIKNDDIIIFAACGQNEEALENTLYGSLFTDGFIEKMNSHNYKESALTVETLFDYMYNYVIERLLQGRNKDNQHPELFVPEKYINFIISEGVTK